MNGRGYSTLNAEEFSDFYEVYSVHQYGMAPALLECAERHDVSAARDALIKGFKWVLGDNQLDSPMLVPELHLTISFAGSERRTAHKQIANASRSL